MNIIAILHTSDYRGDHTADVARWFEVREGETVAALIERLRPVWDRYDKIELRVPDHA